MDLKISEGSMFWHSSITYIDLSHTIQSDIPTWEGTCGFNMQTLVDYQDCTTDTKFRVQRFDMHAGIGTHMDAPAHCIAGAKAIHEVAITTLFTPCVVIDVRSKADVHYSISLDDIHNFENTHGEIQAGSLVAFNTGWDRFWQNPAAYRNDHVFPAISSEAAQYLVNRKIVGVAIDTLGIDRPEGDYPVHRMLLGAGIYIIENATNLDKLPPIGAHTVALPIKIKDATEAPIRFIGIVH